MIIRLFSRVGGRPTPTRRIGLWRFRSQRGSAIALVAIVMITFIVFSLGARNDPGIEDISYVYHGAVVNRDREAIELDVAAIRSIQQSVLELIESAPSSAWRPAREDRTPSEMPLEIPDVSAEVRELLARQAEIEKEIHRLSHEQREFVHGGLSAVGESLTAMSTAPDGVLPQRISVESEDDSSAKPGDSYIETCRANDVPIPPNWPDERWVSRGELPFFFADFPDARTTEVFTYEEPNGQGLCYALVRKNRNRWYEAVGMICQSKATGKACFWDNVVPGERMDNRIRGLEIQLDVRTMGNGSNMRERCTDCHRGENVFLVHPGTPLDAVKQRLPDVRYTPIGQEDWENPSPMEHKGEGACSQCHELAAPTKRFCGLLRQAAEKTMPSQARPAGWDNPLPEYKDAIDRIKARCAAVGG